MVFHPQSLFKSLDANYLVDFREEALAMPFIVAPANIQNQLNCPRSSDKMQSISIKGLRHPIEVTLQALTYIIGLFSLSLNAWNPSTYVNK